MGELAVYAVDRPPPLRHLQDRVDLMGQDAVHRPAARSTSVPVARRRARHRCTRSSETCHSEHTHECANPSATASWTVLRTSSLASAGTLAGSGPLRPSRRFWGRVTGGYFARPEPLRLGPSA